MPRTDGHYEYISRADYVIQQNISIHSNTVAVLDTCAYVHVCIHSRSDDTYLVDLTLLCRLTFYMLETAL